MRPRTVSDWVVLMVMSLAGFVTSFGAHMVAANVGLYAHLQAAAPYLEVGLIIGAYELAEVFLKAPIGLWADRTGRVRILIAGLGVFTLSSFLFAVSRHPGLILLARFLQGIGASAFSPASAAVVATLKEDRGVSFGFYGSIKGLGYAIGPSVGGLVATFWGFDAIFWLMGFLSLAVLLLTALLVREEPRVPGRKPARAGEMLTFLRRVDLWPSYLAMSIGMALFFAAVGFLPLRAVQARGIEASPFLASSLVGVFSGLYLLGQPLAGRFAARGNPRLWLTLALLAAGLGMLAVPDVHSVPALILLVTVFGASLAVLSVVGYTWLAERVAADRMGTAMGVAGTVRELGDSGGPILFGAVAGAASLSTGFRFLGVLAVLGFLAMLLLPRTDAPTAPAVSGPGPSPGR